MLFGSRAFFWVLLVNLCEGVVARKTTEPHIGLARQRYEANEAPPPRESCPEGDGGAHLHAWPHARFPARLRASRQ